MLERGGVENDVGLEIGKQTQDALAVADIGKPAFDLHACLFCGERLQNRVQGGFGILHHQQARGAECHDAVADFRADRAAAAGDDDRLVLHEGFDPAVIDLHGRTQQQILDIDRRKTQSLAAFVERGQAAGRKPKPPRLHQERFRLCIGRERRRREHDPCDAPARIAKLGHDTFEIVEIAAHRNAADRLALVRDGRRQDADRPDFLDRAAFDRAQQHFGIRCAAKDEDRRGIQRCARAGGCANSGNSDRRCADRPGRTSGGSSR